MFVCLMIPSDMNHDPRTFRPSGFNLGGWLSQSPLTDRHIETFIGPSDFSRIADWGFNSVRLPVDASWIFQQEGAGPVDTDHFRFLEKAFGWAWSNGLAVVFDLHQSPWHSFARPEIHDLWKDPRALEKFAAQWAELARRFRGAPGPLWAELLNEPTAADPADWNKVAKALVGAVRAENKSLELVVESTCWGALDKLEPLAVAMSGDHLVLSFHFYEPMFVTHQRAPWWKDGSFYTETVSYPGEPAHWRAYQARTDLGPLAQALVAKNGRHWDKEALRELLRPAHELILSGVPVYCGEFGVYEKAPRATRLAWTRDAVELLKEIGAGWAYWNYKWLDFGVLPKPQGDGLSVPDLEMVELLKLGR